MLLAILMRLVIPSIVTVSARSGFAAPQRMERWSFTDTK